MASPASKNNLSRSLLIAALAAMGFAILINIMSSNQEPLEEVTFSEFKKEVEHPRNQESRIVEAIFQENHLTGIRADKSKLKTFAPNAEDTRRYFEQNK